MSWITKLFGKKKVINTNITFTFMKAQNAEPVESDGEIKYVETDYIPSKNICSHLKVKGTKYYQAKANSNIALYLRLRYYNNFKAESIIDLLFNIPQAIVTKVDAVDNDIIFTVSLEQLLSDHKIDYVLIDRDEDTGKVTNYYSFKNIIDTMNNGIEGYLVVDSENKELNDYLMQLIY